MWHGHSCPRFVGATTQGTRGLAFAVSYLIVLSEFPNFAQINLAKHFFLKFDFGCFSDGFSAFLCGY